MGGAAAAGGSSLRMPQDWFQDVRRLGWTMGYFNAESPGAGAAERTVAWLGLFGAVLVSAALWINPASVGGVLAMYGTLCLSFLSILWFHRHFFSRLMAMEETVDSDAVEYWLNGKTATDEEWQRAVRSEEIPRHVRQCLHYFLRQRRPRLATWYPNGSGASGRPFEGPEWERLGGEALLWAKMLGWGLVALGCSLVAVVLISLALNEPETTSRVSSAARWVVPIWAGSLGVWMCGHSVSSVRRRAARRWLSDQPLGRLLGWVIHPATPVPWSTLIRQHLNASSPGWTFRPEADGRSLVETPWIGAEFEANERAVSQREAENLERLLAPAPLARRRARL